ncbi:MAG: enoyl-CoA hydratase/isomerase family protein [Halioglobus sp.]|nr:enoyl-CoA hydratase/isomerase family protein [Halioglobus sp.]
MIGVGAGANANADVVVGTAAEADLLVSRIERTPLAALVLVQVLRCVEQLPLAAALTVESLAYATLQGGADFRAWLQARDTAPQLVAGGEGVPIIIERDGNVVRAQLNRPANRNAISVEMRDALVELFELLLLDSSIECLQLSGRGDCFSVGGELREFGLATDPAAAHHIRSIHSPGILLARCASRVHCHVHSACLGSGIELPAFAGHLSADPDSFFQLPELGFGLIPGAGGCVSITRRIGRQRTAWMALSGRKVKARQALEWGLVDEIVASAGLVD